MARARKATAEAQEPQGAWHTVREVVAWTLFAAAAACVLYGAWLGLDMHFTKTMPASAIWRILICALLAAALYTVADRIAPLPRRRKRRGNRWINVETPTAWQVWQTAPGDFVESISTAIGIMAGLPMMFIGFGSFVAYDDFADLMIATAICAGAFAIEAAYIKWRGRSIFDPPGQVRKAVPEASVPATKREMDVGGVADAGETAGTAE